MAVPRIISRREWGATRAIPGGRNVPLSSRRFYVAHWPVMGARDERLWMRQIDDIHRRQGWAVIGYNFAVGSQGIYEGAGLMTRGIHSPPRNTDGFGVCFLQPSTAGGTPTAPMSQAMRNNGRALYDWLSSQCGRRLTMSWHGQHFATACPGPDIRAWVQAGMPAAGGPAPAPEQPQLVEEEPMTSELAANGNFHVWMVGPQRRSIWFTVQPSGSTAWGGGRAGQGPAGWSKFWDAPSGRTIRGITAKRAQGGSLHFWATLDNGSTQYCWQRPNESQWRGGSGGSRLGAFAPAP
jgi:hypothetical protein